MEEEDEDGGAVCFIKASVTPQSTAEKIRLSNGNSSSMGTYLLSVCNMDCGQKWTVCQCEFSQLIFRPHCQCGLKIIWENAHLLCI